MRGSFLSCVLLFCGVACIAIGRQGVRDPKAIIEVIPQRDIHIGNTSAGAERRFTFRVRNISDETITLASVHPDCGCTQLGNSNTILPAALEPTESVELVFEWKIAFPDSSRFIKRMITLKLLYDDKYYLEFLTLSATQAD